MHAPEVTTARSLAVRAATLDDVATIMSFGASSSAFRVSDVIPFYEEIEVREWICDTQQNVVLVLTMDQSVRGFLYCKLMSSQWALLDNLFVVREASRHDGGGLLFEALRRRLRELGRNYLTILIKSDRPALVRLASAYGFARRDAYLWMDTFL